MKVAPLSGDLIVKAALILIGVGAAYVAWKKISGAAGEVIDAVSETAGEVLDASIGIVTSNNALTYNATNSSGDKVSAYTGVPVVGTLGAATNALSGGYLADLGGWIGRKTYDLTHWD